MALSALAFFVLQKPESKTRTKDKMIYSLLIKKQTKWVCLFSVLLSIHWSVAGQTDKRANRKINILQNQINMNI